MGFFEKPEYKKPKGEPSKIDKHVKFAMIEKEPDVTDYIPDLNSAAVLEKASEEPRLRETPGDGKDVIWQKIKDLQGKIEELQYDEVNEDPVFRDKVKTLSDRLENLHNNLGNVNDLAKRENIYSQILGTNQRLSRLIEKKDNDDVRLKKEIEALTKLLISLETIPTSDVHLN